MQGGQDSDCRTLGVLAGVRCLQRLSAKSQAARSASLNSNASICNFSTGNGRTGVLPPKHRTAGSIQSRLIKTMPSGTIKWFSRRKLYGDARPARLLRAHGVFMHARIPGFIVNDDGTPDIFFHHSAVTGSNARSLTPAEKVRPIVPFV